MCLVKDREKRHLRSNRTYDRGAIAVLFFPPLLLPPAVQKLWDLFNDNTGGVFLNGSFERFKSWIDMFELDHLSKYTRVGFMPPVWVRVITVNEIPVSTWWKADSTGIKENNISNMWIFADFFNAFFSLFLSLKDLLF